MARQKEDTVKSCLQNKKITVRFIKKFRGMITDPASPMYGGLPMNVFRKFRVPRIPSTGNYVNVLTNDEKDYLEQLMGLPENSLSIYKKVDNYWDDTTEGAINSVTLYRQDTILDLSIPEDYIRYKILLANKDRICPSQKDLEDRPKSTYWFVLIEEEEAVKSASKKANLKFECYTAYGKYKDNPRVLVTIIELLTGHKIASNAKLDIIQTQVTNLIDADAKQFYEVISDKLLETKAILKTAVTKGLISDRNGFYYNKETGEALAEPGQEPTFNIAAEYLNSPANQDLYLSLQAKIKE